MGNTENETKSENELTGSECDEEPIASPASKKRKTTLPIVHWNSYVKLIKPCKEANGYNIRPTDITLSKTNIGEELQMLFNVFIRHNLPSHLQLEFNVNTSTIESNEAASAFIELINDNKICYLIRPKLKAKKSQVFTAPDEGNYLLQIRNKITNEFIDFNLKKDNKLTPIFQHVNCPLYDSLSDDCKKEITIYKEFCLCGKIKN